MSKVINCESALEIWNTLITTHEETSQIKRAKINMFTTQYDNLKMHDNAAIDDMLTYYNKITNGPCQRSLSRTELWRLHGMT